MHEPSPHPAGTASLWQGQLFNGLRVTPPSGGGGTGSGGRATITRFRTQKTAALLAFLAYHLHRNHGREALIERSWPEAEAESGRHSLSLALSSLRNQLEPPGVPAGTVIVVDR
jgi:two-component SAPR family response regulator